MQCSIPKGLCVHSLGRQRLQSKATKIAHQERRFTSSKCSAHKVVVLPGDGIGPEIAKVAQEVLHKAGKACGEEFQFQEKLIGGAAV